MALLGTKDQSDRMNGEYLLVTGPPRNMQTCYPLLDASQIFLPFSLNTLSSPESCPFSALDVGMTLMKGSALSAGSVV